MPATILDPQSWAVQQFEECILGDRRRNKRLMKLAAQFAARPDGSTPDQTETWADCKAAYHLFDEDDVTFDAIVAPHCRQTRNGCASGRVQLLISDTTELDFGHHRKVTGLGPTGNGGGLGFFLHSSLMLDPATGAIAGLAGAKLFYRQPKPAKKPHKNSRRRSPRRESLIWGKLIDEIGPPPEGIQWVHVCDRGADDFEVFHHALQQKCGFVIRAAKLHRWIYAPDGRRLKLHDYLKELPARGTREITVPASKKSPARRATVELCYSMIGMPRPQVTTEWIRQHTPRTPLCLHAVQLREVSPPKGTTPLHWVLYTPQPVSSVVDAERTVAYYERRPTIEDYHKALKTGCHVEYRQYATANRLERVTGVLAVLAVRLVQMKTIARTTPDRPAHEVAPAQWVDVLKRIRRKSLPQVMTIRQFLRELAGLGGHLGRKCDGEPGWITLWRGLEKLLLVLRGADVERHRKCG